MFSLGVFPMSLCRLLASFAEPFSDSDNASVPAGTQTSDPSSQRFHSRQATLSTAPLGYRMTGFIPARSRALFRLGGHAVFHKTGSPRWRGHVPACHCGLPLNLNSQHQPTTGRRKPAPGTSSMCPLYGFLGPSSKPAVLTRILRRSEEHTSELQSLV